MGFQLEPAGTSWKYNKKTHPTISGYKKFDVNRLGYPDGADLELYFLPLTSYGPDTILSGSRLKQCFFLQLNRSLQDGS